MSEKKMKQLRKKIREMYVNPEMYEFVYREAKKVMKGMK